MRLLTPPLTDADVVDLRAGDAVTISGVIYTARDAAHRRLVEMIDRGEELPVELAGQVIYYTGPTPASPGRATGSAGPTTSSRMDRYTPRLLSACGVKALVGKGDRAEEVVRALVDNRAVYLAAVGGAGALLAETIVAAEVVAWPELGTEAIHRLEVREFPAIVAIDAEGSSIYHTGRKPYRR
ncbi:MAG: Fe-S-containing hydro-lyase [Thermoleophilia bacterium]